MKIDENTHWIYFVYFVYVLFCIFVCISKAEKMYPVNTKRPSKDDQVMAMASYNALQETLRGLKSSKPEIVIRETEEKITLPLNVLKLLSDVLKATAEGKIVSVVPIEAEMTTQAAAEYLGCSRPHLVKLLENDEIPFTKVGKHRRVKFEDLKIYKESRKNHQKKLLTEIMKSDEELGLYDS